MMGLGIATSIRIFRQGWEPFILNGEDLKNNLFIAFLFVLACQILTVVVVPLSKFRFTRGYGVVQIILYIGFTVVSILAEMKIVMPHTEIWHQWDATSATPAATPVFSSTLM
jgi:Ca2+/Na+ antiporter